MWRGNLKKEHFVLQGRTLRFIFSERFVLRIIDNMTSTELILNMLAEASTKDISQANDPKTFNQSKTIAAQGGNVAKVAREELEKQTGKSVISSDNATTLRRLSSKRQQDGE